MTDCDEEKLDRMGFCGGTPMECCWLKTLLSKMLMAGLLRQLGNYVGLILDDVVIGGKRKMLGGTEDLAQNRYFEDDSFVGYLKYLEYWQRPEYAKFIVYPHALFFLELLQNPHFRSAMAHPANKELAHRQQFYYWKHHRSNRLKNILPRPMPVEEAPPPPQPPQVSAQAPTLSLTSVPAKSESSARPPGGERRKRKFQTS
ncbi:hypothetical protein GOP47_0001525 [Adiantum capillus-veneris]|uniref:Mediator of RNA polymerase II transcription subunit 31 n=1 Tax=Adiantum capillus-veneris TaxID=13818 RepID=A0A9D4V910_ADICA|nr:hypothetical protein GOP47_0001525 [Adiantum capillus-veneris]